MPNQPIIDGLIDAQEMAVEHPLTFEAPDEADLRSITPGEHVKICRHSERFWVMVTSVKGNVVTGNVANHLVCPENSNLLAGTAVCFEKRHVFSVEA